MIRGENSDSVPLDLITEILSRLPAKSTARFRCVSKLWDSMLGRLYFTELFLTRSSARPRLLLAAVDRTGYEWCFFSSPQPKNPYEKSTSSSPLVVVADIHMKFPGDTWPDFRGHVSGLIYFQGKTPIMEMDKRIVPVICNPVTGQFTILPLPEWGVKNTYWTSFLGFDPIDKQFKVLSMPSPFDNEKEPHQILTLGAGNDSWRRIHCPLNHRPLGEGICINGVLYYLGHLNNEGSLAIVCFDVRSEKFKFVDIDFIRCWYGTKLVNYKDKLGVITLDYKSPPGGRRSLKLCMWVIEDVEKREPEYFSTCWNIDYCDYYSVVGVTATCEIVLSSYFYIVYVNLERNTRQSVEIQGFENINGRVKVFVDHVETLKFITMEKTYSATSTYRRHKLEGINKFDSLRLLDDE